MYIINQYSRIQKDTGWGVLPLTPLNRTGGEFGFVTGPWWQPLYGFNIGPCDDADAPAQIRAHAEAFDPEAYAYELIRNREYIPDTIRGVMKHATKLKRELLKLAAYFDGKEGTVVNRDSVAALSWSVKDAIEAAADKGIILTEDQAAAWWYDHEAYFRKQLARTGKFMLSKADWFAAAY